MSSLFEWLRRNSEHYLIEAAQADMARRYLGRVPGTPGQSGQPALPGQGGRWGAARRPGEGLTAAFWRRVYVPVYRRIPWSVRRRLIVAMPGSHRRSWQGLGELGDLARAPLPVERRLPSRERRET